MVPERWTVRRFGAGSVIDQVLARDGNAEAVFQKSPRALRSDQFRRKRGPVRGQKELNSAAACNEQGQRRGLELRPAKVSSLSQRTFQRSRSAAPADDRCFAATSPFDCFGVRLASPTPTRRRVVGVARIVVVGLACASFPGCPFPVSVANPAWAISHGARQQIPPRCVFMVASRAESAELLWMRWQPNYFEVARGSRFTSLCANWVSFSSVAFSSSSVCWSSFAAFLLPSNSAMLRVVP